MGITDLQRERRRKYIGASDTPAILGVSPWRGPADVFYTKKPYESEDVTTDAMETGNRLEGPLLDFAAEKLGVKIDRRGSFRVSKDNGVLAANLDGPIVDRPEAIEGKYVGETYAPDWGPEGTDQIPADVICQCQHQIYVAELERVHVSAAIARYRSLNWCLYVVERNEQLINIIVDADMRFWNDHVLPGLPPPDVLPSLATLKALKRVPGTVVMLDKKAGKALAKKYEQAHAARSFIEKQVKLVDAEVIAAMDNADALDYGDPDKWFTYMRQERKEYTVPAGSFPKLLHAKRKGN